MKDKLLYILSGAILVALLVGLYPKLHSIKLGSVVRSSLMQRESEPQCAEKLYGVLIGFRYSMPEVYDAITEVARVKNFSCREYIAFLDNMASGNQKK